MLYNLRKINVAVTGIRLICYIFQPCFIIALLLFDYRKVELQIPHLYVNFTNTPYQPLNPPFFLYMLATTLYILAGHPAFLYFFKLIADMAIRQMSTLQKIR